MEISIFRFRGGGRENEFDPNAFVAFVSLYGFRLIPGMEMELVGKMDPCA